MASSTTDGPSVGFASLGLARPLVAAVAAVGYEEATPIQREAIPVLLSGRDLVGQAGTGTGKTAAFALPMLHRLAAGTGPRGRSARGLILVPTRELAMQVAEAVHKYAKGSQLSVVPLFGGAPMHQQIRALERGAHVIVATPGRALDHLRRQTLDLSALEVLVLDEADEMLDMGFAEDLDAILAATPQTRQTALFAATMAPRIQAVATRHLKSPVHITIARPKTAAGKLPPVRQVAYLVAREHKTNALGRVLEFEDPKSAIVFCRTRIEVDQLTDTLTAHGYSAQALHGGMEQRQRDRVMQLFRAGQIDVLVATDVAARGLDIEHVSHVVNYDVPSAPEVYVHRIGRTGRLGRTGVAITLAEPKEHRFLRNIQGLTKQKIEVLPLPSHADLQAKRLEGLREALRATIAKGGLDTVRAFVADMAQEFEVLDIAAAALRLAQDEKDTQPEPAGREEVPSGRSLDERPPAKTRGARPERDRDRRSSPAAPMTTIWVNVGKQANVGPGDLVGAITGEAGVDADAIGVIKIADTYSRVDVASDRVDQIMSAIRGKKIRGQRVDVRLGQIEAPRAHSGKQAAPRSQPRAIHREKNEKSSR